jgi:hypothetical protein
MNDNFLHQLRVQPPSTFSNRLAAKLPGLKGPLPSARRSPIRRGWSALALLAGAAFAAATPMVRTMVSHAWNSIFTADGHASPAEPSPAQAPQPSEISSFTNSVSQEAPLTQEGIVPATANSKSLSSHESGSPNMSCKGVDASKWDNCVGYKKFDNDNVYQGEFHHGLRDGLGFLMVNETGISDYTNVRSNDGQPAIYVGEFHSGRLTGHGVWFTKSGAGYSGTFVDNNIARSDVLHTSCTDSTPSPLWTNCVAKFSYENGNVYYGEVVDGHKDGIGMLEIHETGSSDRTTIRTPEAGFYVGEFSGDRANGRGLIFMPGAGFYGTFTDNKLNTADLGP